MSPAASVLTLSTHIGPVEAETVNAASLPTGPAEEAMPQSTIHARMVAGVILMACSCSGTSSLGPECASYYGPDGCCLSAAGDNQPAVDACQRAAAEAANGADSSQVEAACHAAQEAAINAGLCRPAADGSTGSACTWPRTQTLSQPCCTEYGVDACGASLFCAAFDGRTQATCYLEKSRADAAECAADVHCLSGACNPELQRCRSLPGQACTREIGCAPDPAGAVYVCNPVAENGLPANSCMPASSDNGGLCLDANGCNSRLCVDGRCSSGGVGSTCHAATDCAVAASRCVNGKCSAGTAGSVCTSPADCVASAPLCVSGVCSTGGAGSPCSGGNDCAATTPLCLSGRCSAPKRLGESCTRSSDCKRTDAGTYNNGSAVICDVGTCRIVAGGYCDWLNDLCITGYSCQASAGGQCLNGTSSSCAGELCADSYICFNGQTCQQ